MRYFVYLPAAAERFRYVWKRSPGRLCGLSLGVKWREAKSALWAGKYHGGKTGWEGFGSIEEAIPMLSPPWSEMTRGSLARRLSALWVRKYHGAKTGREGVESIDESIPILFLTW